MLHINNLTYRIGPRLLIEKATVALPSGAKAGLVGRNGAGKTTLLKLVLGELQSEAGSVSVPRNARIGTVAQEAPGGSDSLLDVVLAADKERHELMVESETATDGHRIADIQTRLADIDAHSAPARAATILAGLGFSEAAQNGPCSDLSGGWRMRVALAAALFAAPDVLLLDEPTNYLDLEGVIWLKSYLRGYRHSVLIISHDRDILNDVVDMIVHLDQGKLTLYQGNYDQFERQRREQQALQLKMKKKQEDAKRHMEAFVDRFRYTASKARQAQSRLKALEKMQPIAEMMDQRVVPFHFPKAERHINPPLVRFEDTATGYEDGKPILRDLNLRIDDDDRIALLGSNGNGKSTFAKLLCGKLPVMAGTMRHHKKLQVAYFAQHQLDELTDDLSPYDHFRDLMPDATQAQRRARLGAYGFDIRLADSKASILSGGEKARLLFALAAFEGPHILLMDEPTNHLDVDSREALIHAINEFEGAVILISHDRHLIETCVDRLMIVENNTVSAFDGDMDAYAQRVLEQARMSRRKVKSQTRKEKTKVKAQKQQPAKPERQNERGNRVSLRKKIQLSEASIEKINQKISVLDRALQDPTLYTNEPKKAADFARLRDKLAKDLSREENNWLIVHDELEATR